MANDQQHPESSNGKESRVTTPPSARDSKTSSKRPFPEAYNGNNPKRIRFASSVVSDVDLQEENSEQQLGYSKDEGLGLSRDLEEDFSDDDEYSSNRNYEVKPNQITRQTPNLAQNEIAKIIQKRAIRRLAPTPTYLTRPDHTESKSLPIRSVSPRWLSRHELADRRYAVTCFFNVYDMGVRIRDRGEQRRCRLSLRSFMVIHSREGWLD